MTTDLTADASPAALPSGAAAGLHVVIGEAPAAVLVVNLVRGEVVHVNDVAQQLAPGVRLPVRLDEWSEAAGLRDPDGDELSETEHPLSKILRAEDVPGQPVSAQRRSELGDSREPLWVVGVPMTGAPMLEPHALVVLLAVREQEATAAVEALAQREAVLRERAVLATGLSFTVADARDPEMPLVWVNQAFTTTTGYGFEESVGRNCRFLQGPATDPAAVDTVRAALRERRAVTETLLNYRKDGTAFWNQVSISPVLDGSGELVSFVGVQTDVTERVRVEGEREAAFAAEQAARREAEVAQAVAEQARADAERAREEAEFAQQRLALMAETTSSLTATLDMTELLDRLADLCVPLLADWVFITMVDEHGVVRDTAARHRRGMAEELRAFSAHHAMHLPAGSPSRQAMETGHPVLVPEMTAARAGTVFEGDGTRTLFDQLGGRSALAVPMIARRRTLGAMALVLDDPDRRYGDGDVELVQDLARRAALAMDNVRLYRQELEVAETLQRSLLPVLPEIDGVTAAAHYVSASTAADVGGDFYDLLQLPDGAIGVAIGDVVGHDVAAAAAMGHLRGLLRACVWEPTDADPGAVLGRVDRLVQGLHVAPMATMAYARAVRPAGEGRPWRLDVANAGHPPLLVRHPDGRVELVGATGLLVGVDTAARRSSLRLEVAPGTTLIGYTDGLIEHPGEDLDTGIAALVARLAAAPVGAGPAELCARAADTELDRRDDVALIAVRLG